MLRCTTSHYMTRKPTVLVSRATSDTASLTLASAPTHNGGIHRTGPPAIHAFVARRPMKDAFGSGIAGHHPRRVVVSMMCQRLDCHEVA